MGFNRRKFLSLGLLAISGLAFPSYIVRSVSKLDTHRPGGPLQAALELARQGNILRLAKSFEQAEEKYRQAISLMPNDPRFYDGLRKVLMMQKGKMRDVVDLYQAAYKKNPNNAQFTARLADVYHQTEMGNRPLANSIKQSMGITSLSDEASKLYAKAVSLNPANKVYPVVLGKITALKNNNAYKVDSRKNPAMLAFKNNNVKEHRSKFNKQSDDKLRASLSRIDKKRRRNLPSNELKVRQDNINRSKKKNYYLLVKHYKLNRDYNNAIRTAAELNQKLPQDLQGLGMLKKLYKNSKKYDLLATVSKSQYSNTNSVWSGLAVMRAVKLKKIKSGAGNISEAISVGNTLLSKAGDDMEIKLEILSMLSSLYLADKNYNLSLDTLNKIKAILVEKQISKPSIVNRFFAEYGICLSMKGDFLNAEKVIKTGLGIPDVNRSTDEFSLLSKQKMLETPGQKKILEIALAKVYLKTDPAKAGGQLQRILSLYPQDSFATKRL